MPQSQGTCCHKALTLPTRHQVSAASSRLLHRDGCTVKGWHTGGQPSVSQTLSVSGLVCDVQAESMAGDPGLLRVTRVSRGLSSSAELPRFAHIAPTVRLGGWEHGEMPSFSHYCIAAAGFLVALLFLLAVIATGTALLGSVFSRRCVPRLTCLVDRLVHSVVGLAAQNTCVPRDRRNKVH